MRKLTLLLAALLAPSPAIAADGRLEINQTCAVQTRCLPGDPPGFPVTVDQAGSYVLKSNLSVGDPDTDGLVLTTSRVSIDLGRARSRRPVRDPVARPAPHRPAPSEGSRAGPDPDDPRHPGGAAGRMEATYTGGEVAGRSLE